MGHIYREAVCDVFILSGASVQYPKNGGTQNSVDLTFWECPGRRRRSEF